MSKQANAGEATLTVDRFRELPEVDGYRLELVRGRVAREPAPGPRHGQTAFAFLDLLRRFGKDAGLGLVFFDTGFVLSRDPDTVRVPDVAFVTTDRIPAEGIGDQFWELAPDVVVEVTSPSNSASDMQRRALDYLDAGARLVWVADPATRTVAVYRSRTDIRILEGADVLVGDEVLPELRVRMDELLD